MPDISLFCLLLSSLDQKQILLLRFYELQIEFLQKRIAGRLAPNLAEKAALGRLAAEIGRPDLADRLSLFHVETLFRWHKEMFCQKYDSSKTRSPGRPAAWKQLTDKVLQLAQDNPRWGAPRIHGQLKSLGFGASEPTIWRLMRRLGLDPNPPQTHRWSDFLERHKAAMVSTDFFSIEAMTPTGLKTFYALFFIQHDTRKICLGGVTEHPSEAWVSQVARNLTMEGQSFFNGRKFLVMDRDTKYCKSFQRIFKDAGVKPLVLPIKSPNLNAYAERWIRSVREECLNNLLFLPNERSILNVLNEYVDHFHHERCHQGLCNTIPFPLDTVPCGTPSNAGLQCKSRLGGMLKYYYLVGENEQNKAA